jgi:hypothetical protein
MCGMFLMRFFCTDTPCVQPGEVRLHSPGPGGMGTAG